MTLHLRDPPCPLQVQFRSLVSDYDRNFLLATGTVGAICAFLLLALTPSTILNFRLDVCAQLLGPFTTHVLRDKHPWLHARLPNIEMD